MLATLAGCGGGSDAAVEGGSYERLVLRPESGAPLETTVLHRFEIDPDADGATPWRIRAGSQRVIRVPAPDGSRRARAIELQGPEGSGISIDGPFEAESFNRVVITVVHGHSAIFRVHATGTDGEAIASRSIRSLPRPGPNTLTFDLHELLRSDGACASLAVECLTRSSRFAILSIELLHQPWEDWFSPAAAGPDLLDVGEVACRGWGLASTRPLVGEWDVRRGQELVFAYGLHEELRREGDRPRIRVTLHAQSGARIERELELEGGLEPASAWHWAAIDLASLAGERVTARFELLSPLAGTALAALGEPALVSRSASAPTFVLITSDTHRGDHLGIAPRSAGVRTPFLDSLAARGTFYEDCISSANVTKPSHAGMMTGISPRDTGVAGNEACLADAAPTLAEAFRAAGYVTLAAVSSSPLGHRTSGLGQGFDRMAAPHGSQRVSVQTIRALRAWLPDVEGMPLFVWLHVFDAHKPYDAPARYEGLYYPPDRDPYDPNLPDPPERAVPDWKSGVRDLDYLVGLYKSEISYLDDQLEKLFEEPRFSAATVAFTADHGESLTAHEVYFEHRELYPDTLHVPLILAGPGVPEGTRVPHGVHNLDVGRTLLDLAGLDRVEFPGRNLLALARQPDGLPRFSLASNGDSASVYAGRWFGALHLRERSEPSEAERHPQHSLELYDLEADPGCVHDLAGEEREQARRIRGLLVDWLVHASPRAWAASTQESDPDALAQLAELGYAADEPADAGSLWFDPECRCEECSRHE